MLKASRAKVFENNQTYAVNIPQELKIQAEEVYKNKIGGRFNDAPVNRLAETLERGASILASYSDMRNSEMKYVKCTLTRAQKSVKSHSTNYSFILF